MRKQAAAAVTTTEPNGGNHPASACAATVVPAQASILAATAALALLAIAGCAAITDGAATTGGATELPAPAAPAPVVEQAPLADPWEAAGNGDVDALQAHLAAGTNLNGLHAELGITPLVAAIATRRHEAVRWLLANGADVNARTGDGGSALIAAAFMGVPKIAEMLLDAGADASIRNDNGQTVWNIAGLDWRMTKAIADSLELEVEREAVEAGRTEILALLKPRLDALAQDDIWLAAASGDIDAVHVQIEAGQEVNAHNPDSGATLLTIAALFGHLEIAAMLIKAGADVNKPNSQDGSTPLHAAALFGHAEIVLLLLDNGADPNVTSAHGGTPLMAAELDWATTQYVAATLQVPLDEGTMKLGKTMAAELLRVKLSR